MRASPEGQATEAAGNANRHSMSGASGEASDRQHIRLACQACQRKKIKCDRWFPCGQCARSNLHCVASTRKPRARHSGKRTLDTELRNRISKLENLVETLSGEVGSSSSDAVSPEKDEDSVEQAAEQPARKPSVAVEKYLGREFWSSLTSEFQALKDALEEDQGEGEEDDTTPSSTSANGPASSAEYDLLICPPGAIYVMPGALNEPNPDLSRKLFTIFCKNIDDLFKMYHQPTLRHFMLDDAPYLGHDPNTLGNKAVKASVWYAAVNTMTEHDCRLLLGQSRPDALQHYRRIIDIALAQADLMNTSDIATLQAFTTYLAVLRMPDPGRRMWTLIAVAVRIAKAMGLHREGAPRSAFMTETRRRLFHQIRFLDAYCCIDRGSEGLITPGSFDTLHPSNVDDTEYDEDSTSIPNHERKLTDQSFALMAYAATERTHLLFIPEENYTLGATWQERLQMAEKFEREIDDKYINLCDRSKPYQRMMALVASGMTSSMKLRAVRPVQKHVSSVPPRVDSPYVLQLATNTLVASEAILSDPETSHWRWMIWVPWHGLAVTLAGLCSIRDTPLAARAWRAAEASYARNLRFVAEGRHGMLWRPIEKLYRKASAFRDHQDSSPASPVGRQVQASAAYSMNTDAPGTVGPPAHAQVPPPQQQERNHNNLPHGGMPTSNFSMDFDFSDINLNDTTNPNTASLAASKFPLQPTYVNGNPGSNTLDFNAPDLTTMDLDADFTGGDISWMDFDRILEDMNNASSGSSGYASADPSGMTGNAMGEGLAFSGSQWPAANVLPENGWPGYGQ